MLQNFNVLTDDEFNPTGIMREKSPQFVNRSLKMGKVLQLVKIKIVNLFTIV